jgi:DNA polymerase (family 10)
MQRFTAYDEVIEVLSAGTTRASVVLKSGLQVDLRMVAQASYGAALCYFTGSKTHNIAIRRIAQKTRPQGQRIRRIPRQRAHRRRRRGIGLQKRRPAVDSTRTARGPRRDRSGTRRTPAPPGDVFRPARRPACAYPRDRRLRQPARHGAGCKKLGLEYIAITEHSRHLTVAHGLDPLRLARQCDEIDRLNPELNGITLLKGIEVDILEDGSLDLADEVLGRLDLVVGAVHSQFHLSRAKQTQRILRAMDHPHFTLLAHPAAA